ncbi:unnamed protein product [Cylindrotheca closterium]|uniref:Uncharacterized protein n=1 Tax=Cylindrotheca closterium TaxID=2856 RepID=A0AAD2G5U9_9STRA|nr:unnamed protein product [Cylindrotheca closterium]
MAESEASDALASSSQFANKLKSPLRKGKRDDLDERQPIPAWKLRERMKNESRPVYKPRAVSRTPLRGNSSLDPSLPPAFQAAAAKQRKKEQDDFMSLDSVHSSKTQRSRLTNDDSNSDPDGSSSLSDEDSFASIGEDEHDDEAYREGRNQIARQTLECAQSTRPRATRLKKGGINSRPLEFIAE